MPTVQEIAEKERDRNRKGECRLKIDRKGEEIVGIIITKLEMYPYATPRRIRALLVLSRIFV